MCGSRRSEAARSLRLVRQVDGVFCCGPVTLKKVLSCFAARVNRMPTTSVLARHLFVGCNVLATSLFMVVRRCLFRSALRSRQHRTKSFVHTMHRLPLRAGRTAMQPNYAFKPTAGGVCRSNPALLAGGGLTRRWAAYQ